MPVYDFCKEVTITGQVVNAPALAVQTDVDWSMTIRTADGVEHRIFLAPASFFCNLGFTPTPGSTISIIGIPVGSGCDIVARQVVYGCQVITLRDVTGAPLWGSAPNTALMNYAALWNPGNMVTVSGTIDCVGSFYPAGSTFGSGTSIRLINFIPDNLPSWQVPPYDVLPRAIVVDLGPTPYVNERLAGLRRGRFVTVSGSVVHTRGQTVLIASTVQSGNHMVAFRNYAGAPVWVNGWDGWSQATVQAMSAPLGPYQTITGRIQEIQGGQSMAEAGTATVLTLQLPSGCLVAMAVAAQTGICFKVGDTVTVTGYLGVVNSQEVVIANQIDYNCVRYAMNNVNGTCAWQVVGAPAGSMVVTQAFGPPVLMSAQAVQAQQAGMAAAPAPSAMAAAPGAMPAPAPAPEATPAPAG